MAKKVCLLCGKEMGMLTGKVGVKDGWVCDACWTDAGFDPVKDVMLGGQYTGEQLRGLMRQRLDGKAQIDNFQPTKTISNLAFDDNSRTFLITHSKKLTDLYRYDQIVDFELLEDGSSITKGGLGRAVAGGVLFGGVGAIVGGVTGGKKTKNVCDSLKIKITFRNSPKQTAYIDFITTSTKKDGFLYKQVYKSAQDAMAALQIATDMANTQAAAPVAPTAPAASAADEILKYKNLLDAGVITQAEFDAKKAQLLGL